MVLHGDGSMNAWIMNALLPFAAYWVDGRTNTLGVAMPSDQTHPYIGSRNEQFDLVVSNPPFAIKMPPDERERVLGSFSAMSSASSETLFIERWYQLLREGGRFCCIVPEAVLDTATNASVRRFLLQHFRIDAVVALPYDAFRPFTSTKTCIALATKRTRGEVERWKTSYSNAERANRDALPHHLLKLTLEDLGWAEQPVFMAEPQSAGYKRRKGLANLRVRNDLYREDEDGNVASGVATDPTTVLDHYLAGPGIQPSPTLGFWTTLRQIASRPDFRLDPKYRWLWDFQDGLAHGRKSEAVPLSDLLEIVDLPKVKQGDLPEETTVVDLEYVESRQGILSDRVPSLETIGSDKVRFDGCELAMAKLEPYLGKVFEPPAGSLGSTEWVGLKRRTSFPLPVLMHLLLLRDMCEAYRRLQSGKRHARFDPREFLALKVELPPAGQLPALGRSIEKRRSQIADARKRARTIRESIDALLAVPEAETPPAPLIDGLDTTAPPDAEVA
jgi:type I restriction enzyme M protein